uniref:Uncharacterized protein n=1 Tax=Polytomella parva TaxID=51329 RepID=A0A7S0YLA3_9CHLO
MSLSTALRSSLRGIASFGSVKRFPQFYNVYSQFPSHFSTETETKSGEDFDAIVKYRCDNNFKRNLDGHVQLLHNEDGCYWDVKLDGNVPGAVLIRSPEKGEVYFLRSENLRQIDLSNDRLIGRLFGDNQWQGVKEPLMAVSSDGAHHHLKLARDQFLAVFSLLIPVDEKK